MPGKSNKSNNGSEKEAGHHRHHREEKTTMVWSCQKDAKWENIKINYGLDTTGEKEKEDVQEKHGWKEYKQPWQQEI